MRKTAYNSFQFAPGNPGNIQTMPDILRYVQDLESRLQAALTALSQMKLERLHAPPDRPRDGQLFLADGVDWDPGTGRGVYVYDEDVAAYNQLG